MRTITRVLMRVSRFDAPNEKAFIEGIKKVNWSELFAKSSFFDIKFTSKSSKLSMPNQIQECLTKELKGFGVKYKKGAPALYVRLFRDQCSISFDTTGEAAFKRGEAQKGSIASLRGTTAHALLRILMQGVNKPIELVDPMCGSGTFLHEALSWGQSLDRNFSYEKTPLVSAVADTMQELKAKETRDDHLFKKIYGMDSSEKALQVAEKNLQGWPPDSFELVQEDMFRQQKPSSLFTEPPFIIINPPWGKRLPGTSQDLLKAIWDKFQPQRIGLLMPARWKLSPIPMERVRDLPILVSGVETRFIVLSQ